MTTFGQIFKNKNKNMKKLNTEFLKDFLLSVFLLLLVINHLSCNKLNKPAKSFSLKTLSLDSVIADETYWIKSDFDQYDRNLVYTTNDSIKQIFANCTKCTMLKEEDISYGCATFFLMDSSVNPVNILNK